MSEPIEFKPENVGNTIVEITKGQFKGYKIIIRTTVSYVTFDGKYDESKLPIFMVTHHDKYVVIPLKTDLRKDMK